MKSQKLFSNQFSLNTARLAFFAGGPEGARHEAPVKKETEKKAPESRETKDKSYKDQADMVARKRQEQVDRAQRENLSTAKDLESRARNLLNTSKSKDNNADEKNMNKDLVLQLAKKLLDIDALKSDLVKLNEYKPEELLDARVKVAGETIFLQIVAKDFTYSYELGVKDGYISTSMYRTGKRVSPRHSPSYMQDEEHFYAPPKKDERVQL